MINKILFIKISDIDIIIKVFFIFFIIDFSTNFTISFRDITFSIVGNNIDIIIINIDKIIVVVLIILIDFLVFLLFMNIKIIVSNKLVNNIIKFFVLISLRNVSI